MKAHTFELVADGDGDLAMRLALRGRSCSMPEDGVRDRGVGLRGDSSASLANAEGNPRDRVRPLSGDGETMISSCRLVL